MEHNEHTLNITGKELNLIVEALLDVTSGGDTWQREMAPAAEAILAKIKEQQV